MLLWLGGTAMDKPIFVPAPQGDVDDLIFADCEWRASER